MHTPPSENHALPWATMAAERALRMPWYSFAEERLVDALPPAQEALDAPNGLLAAGGDLEPETLVAAYAAGIFPWPDERGVLLWWSPDPRTVLRPAAFHTTRSLAKRMRNAGWRIVFDTHFDAVVAACAAPRAGQRGTWIRPALRAAYARLARLGIAHSVEVWRDDALVGGLYGLALGEVFFGESMFSIERDASKAALAVLCARLEAAGWALVDCQVDSAHLASLGAVQMPREEFLALLAHHAHGAPRQAPWTEAVG